MRNVLGVDEDFPTDFVLVLETSPEKSDYENEDDEDDPASVFLIPSFQLLASDFTLEHPCHKRHRHRHPRQPRPNVLFFSYGDHSDS
jgi:hypothetical protein